MAPPAALRIPRLASTIDTNAVSRATMTAVGAWDAIVSPDDQDGGAEQIRSTTPPPARERRAPRRDPRGGRRNGQYPNLVKERHRARDRRGIKPGLAAEDLIEVLPVGCAAGSPAREWELIDIDRRCGPREKALQAAGCRCIDTLVWPQ
jgi:hypothetical protein